MEPVPRSSAASSPIAERSFRLWYTVRNEIVGSSDLTAAYTASAVGWCGVLLSTRKITCRCGVTLRPRLRNNAVNSSTDFISHQV